MALISISVLGSFFLYGCSANSNLKEETIEYAYPNLTKEGVMYDIEIEQNLEGSIIKSTGRIRFSPKCEYFLNVNAYTNPENEFVFTISKSPSGTAFVRAKAPDSEFFTSWSDYRDPGTPGAIIMYYPAMVMNGDPEGHLCSIDKIYNFMEKGDSVSTYTWKIDFLENYTLAAAASWRDMIADASGLEGSSRDKLRQNLESILVPNSTFALQSFPEAVINESSDGYTIFFESDSDLSMKIILKESEADQSVAAVNAIDFPARLSSELEGLTDEQILSQFPDNTPKANNN